MYIYIWCVQFQTGKCWQHSTLPCANVGPGIGYGKFKCRKHLPVWNYTHQMQIYMQVIYKLTVIMMKGWKLKPGISIYSCV